jgi:hypothetical protein
MKFNQISGFIFLTCIFIWFCVSPSIANSSVIVDDDCSFCPQIFASIATQSLRPVQRQIFNGCQSLNKKFLYNNDAPDNLKGIITGSEKILLLPGFFFILFLIFILYFKIFLPSQSPRSPPEASCR